MNESLQVISFITGILSVYYATKSNRNTFVLGSVSNLSLILFGVINGFYGTILINSVLLVTCLFGYIRWSKAETEITFSRNLFINVSILVTCLLVGFSFTGDIDLMTSMIGVGATILLIYRHYLNWLYWIIMDFFFIGFYMQEEHYIVALQYAVFLGLCVYGINEWSKQLENTKG